MTAENIIAQATEEVITKLRPQLRAFIEGSFSQLLRDPTIFYAGIEEEAEVPAEEIEPLSEKEKAVLRYMSRAGLAYWEIAEELDISESTVKARVRSIFGKLGVHKRKDAVSEACRRKLL